jgi:hypothetical protein
MEKDPNDIPDETTPPQEQPLIVADALADISGIPLSEFTGLTLEQLNSLFDDPEIDENIFIDPKKIEEIRQKNAQILREKIKAIRSS